MCAWLCAGCCRFGPICVHATESCSEESLNAISSHRAERGAKNMSKEEMMETFLHLHEVYEGKHSKPCEAWLDLT
jgi:hypothetical protein